MAPLCPYLAILAWWSLRTAHIPREDWDSVPLFTAPEGHPADPSPRNIFQAKHVHTHLTCALLALLADENCIRRVGLWR